MGTLGPLRGFLLLFQAFVPQSVAAYAPTSGPDFRHDLGRELLGVHYEWFRGWSYLQEVPVTAQDVPEEMLMGLPQLPGNGSGAPKLPSLTLTLPIPNLTVPCLHVMGYSMVEPCGIVPVPLEGVNFTSPFGSYHVPGLKVFDGELKVADNAFSEYTGYVTGVIGCLYFLYGLVFKCKRDTLKKMASGNLPSLEPDPTSSPEEQDALEKERKNPDSDKFLCPGNIYRLVCVMHPGEVGYHTWAGYVFKAAMCAYMQLYLPFTIVCHCFRTWHFNNVKSPLYFAYNAVSFATQFAALSNVCCLFAGRCARTVEGDAIACVYLCQHDAPEGKDNKVGAAPSNSLVTPLLPDAPKIPDDPEAAAAEVKKMAGNIKAPSAEEVEKLAMAKAMAIMPVPSGRLLTLIELLCCIVNMFVTCTSSLLLMLAMFLKVATFQGDIMNISIIAVSLYFVFELDDKVMESDPQLRPRYRRKVLLQSVKNKRSAAWIKMTAQFTIMLLNNSVPFGLLGIVLISWRGGPDLANPVVIGGDPFH